MDSFLLAALSRARDTSALPPPTLPDLPVLLDAPVPPPPPPSASNLWRGARGLCEVNSFFSAASSTAGSQALAMADDGDTFVTRAFDGDDGKVGIFSVTRGAIKSLDGHTDMICALSLDGDRLASAAADGT